MLRGYINGRPVIEHGMGHVSTLAFCGLGQANTPLDVCLVNCVTQYPFATQNELERNVCKADCVTKYPPGTSMLPPPRLPSSTETPKAPKKAPTGKGSSTRPFSASTQAPPPEFWGQQPAIDWKVMAMGGVGLALLVLLLGRRTTPVVVSSPAVAPAPAPAK